MLFVNPCAHPLIASPLTKCNKDLLEWKLPELKKRVGFAQVDPHIKTLRAPNPKSLRRRWAFGWPCLRLIANTSIIPADSGSLTTYCMFRSLPGLRLCSRNPRLSTARIWLAGQMPPQVSFLHMTTTHTRIASYEIISTNKTKNLH